MMRATRLDRRKKYLTRSIGLLKLTVVVVLLLLLLIRCSEASYIIDVPNGKEECVSIRVPAKSFIRYDITVYVIRALSFRC